MYTAEDLQRILGLTRKQLRARLAALEGAGLLVGQVRVGPRGRREFSVAVVEMLREVHEVARTHGIPVRQAAQELARRVRGEAEPAGVLEQGQARGNAVQLAAEVARLQGIVEALREQIEMMRAENERLWAQIQRLTGMLEAQAALPKPRRPWWRFWG